MDDFPVYKFKVKESGTDTGMIGISLVSDPAIMSNWQEFSVQNKPKYIALQNEDGSYKQELLGAALRPDLPILRVDDYGNYYYGVFEKDTIETIRNKFHKQKYTSEVNVQHDPNQKVDAYLIESYILETEEQLKSVNDLGLTDVEVGAWIVRYKVESEDVFKQALEGDLNGFSVEVLLQRELTELHKNNNINLNNNVMSKIEELVKKFKTVLDEFEDENTNDDSTQTEEFEDAKLADSDVVLRFTDVGSPVYQVITDEEQNETTELVEAGEYILEDGRTLIVDDSSNLSEISDAEPAPAEETGMNEEDKGGSTQTEDLEETSTEDTGTDLNKSLSELIPTDVDGTYQLEVYVSGGAISFGTLYAWTYKDLQLKAIVEKYEEMSKEVVKLKEQLEKPIGAPVFDKLSDHSNKKSKKDFKNNLEYTLHRLHLDND
jgi:hypothetical protein